MRPWRIAMHLSVIYSSKEVNGLMRHKATSNVPAFSCVLLGQLFLVCHQETYSSTASSIEK